MLKDSLNSASPQHLQSKNGTFLLKIKNILVTPLFMKSVAVAGLVLVLAGGYFVHHSIQANPYWRTSTDFGTYVRATVAIKAGHTPYDPQLYPPLNFYGTDQVHDQYAYPPLFADFLTLLTFAGETTARYIWLLLSVTALVGSFVMLLRSFGNRVPWSWIVLTIGIIGLLGITRSDLYHGQVNHLILFLFVAGLWFYLRGNSLTTSLLWAIMFVLKPFLGVLVLYLIWKKDWKPALASVISAAVLLALSFVPLLPGGIDTFQKWLQASSYYSAAPMAARPDNEAFYGVFLRLFNPNPFTEVWLNSTLALQVVSLLLVVLLVGAFIMAVPRTSWRTNLNKNAVLLVETGLLFALLFSFGPLTEGDHLYTLLPGGLGIVMVTLQRQRERSPLRRGWWVVAGLWVCLFTLVVSPLHLSIGIPGSENWYLLKGVAILWTAQTALVLLLASLALAFQLWRERTIALQRSGATQLQD